MEAPKGKRDRLMTEKEVYQAELGFHCLPAPFLALLHSAFPPHSLPPVLLPFGLGTHPWGGTGPMMKPPEGLAGSSWEQEDRRAEQGPWESLRG